MGVMIAGVESATQQVQPFWAELPPADRARYLRRAGQVVLDVADRLVPFLGQTFGRSPAEAWAVDLLPGVDALNWAARTGPKALAPQRIRPATPLTRGRRGSVLRRPLGVVAVHASARDPWAGPLLRVGVALMAGNGVLLAPAPGAERMMRLFERAGLPERIVSAVDEGELAGARCAWDDGAAGREDPGPMLVLGDADLDAAAGAAAWARHAAGGALPRGLSEAIVLREAAEAFADRVAARAPQGPEPLPLARVQSEDEGLARARGARGGVASVWTQDDAKAQRVAAALPFDVVWTNDHGAPIRPRPRLAWDEATRAGLVAGGGWSPWRGAAARPGLERGLRAIGTLAHGRESDRAAALRDGARPLLGLLGRR